MRESVSPPAARASSHRRRHVLLAALLAAAIGVGAYLTLQAPRAPALAFTDIQGKRFDSQSLRGKVVMVNFWATSCGICIQEMPQLVKTHEAFKGRGLEFFAVAMPYDPPNLVLDYAHSRQLPFHVVLDIQGELVKAFGNVQQTPTTFVIDRRGMIVKRYLGEPDWRDLHRLLDQSLQAGV